MTDDTPPGTPPDRVHATLDAFYALYQELAPDLTKEQLELIYRRLERYAREIQDDVSRAPGGQGLGSS
jgi:hypothetical protein